jgi:hypothetical protein
MPGSMYSDRRSLTTVTSFVTNISVQAAITEGQKMGMEAHMMAKSTSRQEKMRTSGIHHVKSYIVGVLSYFRPLHKRRIAIKMTLYVVSSILHKLDFEILTLNPKKIGPSLPRPASSSSLA